MTLAILVPVLGRPHQIKPLLASIANNTTSEHRVVFVCSPNDKTTSVCEETGETVILVPWEPGRADFAKKINFAYRLTDEDWLFQAATDLKFHPGWDTNALLVAQRTNAGVVGTNDLGNPTVKRGLHSTHTFFSRSYIEQFGSGTFDNSGRVFSELYDHQWTDNEFVQTAKLRGRWAFAKRSIVEHQHPHWGKGKMDDTYDKALRETRADMQLFHKRMRMMLPARNKYEERLQARARRG